MNNLNNAITRAITISSIEHFLKKNVLYKQNNGNIPNTIQWGAHEVKRGTQLSTFKCE